MVVGPVLVLSHEECSPGEWGLYCYALLFSTTQHLVFNIPFNIILLIFSAPFFHFSLSLTRGIGTLLLRSIIFNNPTPLFNIPFNIFLLIFSAPFFHFSLYLTRGMGTLLLRSIIFNNPTTLFQYSL